MSNFSVSLREIRRSKKVSQRDLGEAVGCGPLMISNFEAGKAEPSLDMILKLAKYLDVSVGQLLNEENIDTLTTKI